MRKHFVTPGWRQSCEPCLKSDTWERPFLGIAGADDTFATGTDMICVPGPVSNCPLPATQNHVQVARGLGLPNPVPTSCFHESNFNLFECRTRAHHVITWYGTSEAWTHEVLRARRGGGGRVHEQHGKHELWREKVRESPAATSM